VAYTIVTFDGGGIRGLISALLLQQLQSDVQGKTNQNFLASVSMFAGTSTGSFLALSMAQDPSATNVNNLVSLYLNDGPRIFTPFNPSTSAPRLAVPAALPDAPRPTGAASSLGSWWDIIVKYWDEFTNVRYDNTALQTLLQKQLGSDATIGGLVPDILVNTLQLWNGTTWVPFEITKSSAPAMTLSDAALCSGAAPTYFPPFSPMSNTALGYCVDGGTFANNPAVAAITSAVAAGNVLSDIALLSFGTGLVPEGVSIVGTPTGWGTLEWVFPAALPPQPAVPLLAAMMDGSSQLAHAQAGQLLGASYTRLNPTLSQPIALDDTSSSAMQAMKDAADSLIQSDGWSNIVDWVAGTFATSIARNRA
jgi:predicted acylesterase/phospholipase RssA